MELESKYTVAGLFVLILSVLILVTLLWVSDATGRHDSREFVVIFNEHSLDGLQKDSQVTMKGIKIGSVDSFSIDSGNIEAVKAVLLIDNDIPVKVNTKAVVRRNILTGLAWVDLVDGTQEADEIESKEGQSPPVIAEGKSQIDQLASSLPGLIEQVNETLGHIRVVFSEENSKKLTSTISDISEITAKLNSRSEKFDSILGSVDTTLEKVAKASDHFENVAAGLNTGIGEVRSDLHATLEKFNRDSSEALNAVGSSADIVSQEFVLMSQSVDEASRSISRTMEAFEQPRDILTGPPSQSFGPGEK